MSESNIDCNVCKLVNICKILSSVQTVASVARDLSFSCKHCLPKGASQEKENSIPAPPIPKKKEEKGEGKPTHTGKCESCQKEGTLYQCDNCGKWFCSNCMEISTEVDPFSETTKQRILCMKCSREEDEY